MSNNDPMHDTLTDKRNHSFFMVDNEIVSHFELTPHQLAVYITLLYHADRRTKTAFPGLSTIADESGMSRRTVIKSIQELESLRLIQVTRVKSESRGNEVNHYTIQDVKSVVLGGGSESNSPGGSAGNALGVVQEMHPNNTHNNKTINTNVFTGDFDFDKYKQTIADTFGVNGNRVMNLLHLMRGTATKGDYKKYSITPAATIAELVGFKRWYYEQYNANIPLSPEKIQSHFLNYRVYEAKRQANDEKRVAKAAATIQPEATPEQRQATIEAIRRAKEQLKEQTG